MSKTALQPNVIELKTSKTKRLVSPKQAAALLAKHKREASWCVDMSGNFPILLHALSNRTGTVQELRLGFTQWAEAEGIRVDCDSYSQFLAALPDRVMALLPRVHGMGMRPCSDRFITDDTGILLANIFNPAVMGEPQPIPAPFDKQVDLFGLQVPEVLAHMFERAFPNISERLFIIQRLAAIVQTPMRRVKHAVFLVGEGGTGKSTILDILETALCRRHIDRSLTYTAAHDPHSEALCNNRAVAFEDKPIGNGGELYVYTLLKQTIDYDRRTINIKHGQRSVQRELHSSIFITTNNQNLFPWDSNERRFYAPQKMTHLVSDEESKEFFRRFHAFLELPEAAAFLYHWLDNVDMAGFDYGSCPRTSYMQELIDQSGTMLDKNLDEFLDGKDHFHPKSLSDFLTARKQPYKSKELKDSLERRGLQYARPWLKGEGFPDSRFSFWRMKPAPGRHFRDLSDEEKADLVHSEGITF